LVYEVMEVLPKGGASARVAHPVRTQAGT